MAVEMEVNERFQVKRLAMAYSRHIVNYRQLLLTTKASYNFNPAGQISWIGNLAKALSMTLGKMPKLFQNCMERVLQWIRDACHEPQISNWQHRGKGYLNNDFQVKTRFLDLSHFSQYKIVLKYEILCDIYQVGLSYYKIIF